MIANMVTLSSEWGKIAFKMLHLKLKWHQLSFIYWQIFTIMINLAEEGSKLLQKFWKTTYQCELQGLKMSIFFVQI